MPFAATQAYVEEQVRSSVDILLTKLKQLRSVGASSEEVDAHLKEIDMLKHQIGTSILLILCDL